MVTYVTKPQVRPPETQRRVLFWVLVGLGAFVALNLLLLIVFHNRTYPLTSVAGKSFGSVTYSRVPDKLQALTLLPTTLSIDYGKGAQQIKTTDLGIAIDEASLAVSVKQRNWLPIFNLLVPKKVPLALSANDAAMQRSVSAWAAAVDSAPTNARIIQGDTAFSFSKQVNGKKLDTAAVRTTLLREVSKGRSNINIPPDTVEPEVTDGQLQSQFARLKDIPNTTLTYRYGGKQQQAIAPEIVGWYRSAGNGYEPSDIEIRAFLHSLGMQWRVSLSNIDAAVTATRQALADGKPLDFQLKGTTFVPAKTLTYCTSVRGVDASLLPMLDRKIASTLADERGWSLDGKIAFDHATSGCDMTIWLAAADQMPTFGAICDTQWSCNVSPNIVINYNRWLHASDAWNASGGNINDYRSMALNHETGHRLGFYHSMCPGAGQPAPVMQQQSINLDGCTFNPWPTAKEQTALRTMLGL